MRQGLAIERLSGYSLSLVYYNYSILISGMLLVLMRLLMKLSIVDRTLELGLRIGQLIITLSRLRHRFNLAPKSIIKLYHIFLSFMWRRPP